MFSYNTSTIKIVEVGPRDGLQNEKKALSVADKISYIKLLAESGLRTIEATSFVRADKIPQMSGATELFQKLSVMKELNDINLPCLVPNLKGYEMAKSVGVKEISLFSATSDAFTQKNINCSVNESFLRMKDVADLARKDGVKMRGYISTAFGCPYQGEVPVKDLVSTIERFLELGVYEISIGDTIGVARPKQVSIYLKEVLNIVNKEKIAMHFHDTRGMAIANILTSLEVGIEVFDASSGGLGGCPYADGASGNVATEELVYLCESLGLETGVNMNKLLEASGYILTKIGKASPSKLVQAELGKK